MTLPSETKMDATITLHGININFLSQITTPKVLALKSQLFFAIKKIERSAFKKVLTNSTVMVGNWSALNDEGLISSEPFAYYPAKDILSYSLSDEPVYPSIIHEYGHRYHHKMIAGGFKNKALISLYKSSQYCFKGNVFENIPCPSEYGAKNHMEFFAEMFTLIILGLVKPSQQAIANEFMQIVNQESI